MVESRFEVSASSVEHLISRMVSLWYRNADSMGSTEFEYRQRRERKEVCMKKIS